MTVQEIHVNFRLQWDNINSFQAPDLSAEEIDVILNNAQDDLILDCKKNGFESTQTIRDYLRNIKTNANLTSFTNNSNNQPNDTFVELPPDYRTMVKEEVTVSYTDCNDTIQTKRIKVKPITEDTYNNIINDPFRKPNINSIDEYTASMEYEKINNVSNYELITDGTFTPTIYHIRYIRNPQRIQYGANYATPIANQDCELNEEAQKEIIKRAVILAKLYVQANSYQITEQHKQLEDSKY